MGYDPNEESVPSYRLSLITLFIGSFVAVYHIVSLNVSLTGFIQIFHSELGTVQWLITGFTLATGIIAPISGYLGNRFSNKKLFLFSICGLTVSSILCSFAWNVYVLIIFRIIQGIFCGLIQPVSLAMIYQTIPRGKQALAISLDRVGPMPLVAIGAILLAAASWKFSHLRVDTTLTYVAGWMSIRYIGIGLSMTPAMNAGMRVVSRNLSGHAAALINWLRQVSGALALGMFTSIFYSRMGVHLEELNLSAGQNGEKWVHSTAYTMSVDDAFLIAGLFALTAVPLALLLHQKGDDTSEEQTGTSA